MEKGIIRLCWHVWFALCLRGGVVSKEQLLLSKGDEGRAASAGPDRTGM